MLEELVRVYLQPLPGPADEDEPVQYKQVAAKLSPPRGRHTKIRRSEWESRTAALNTEEKRKKPMVI